MAELNDKKYEEWEEYISDKFFINEFDVSEDKNTSSTKIITVTSKEPTSKTKIVFDFPTSGLCRVCFYHPDSPLHNIDNDKERLRALMYSDYELTTENLMNTNEYLEIPLHFGWTEQATYYKEQLIKSEVLYYDGIVWQTIFIERNLSWFDKAGCLITLFAWPILYIQHRLVKHRLNKNTKNVRITTSHILPMKQQKSTNR
jgi:hypothetical protein